MVRMSKRWFPALILVMALPACASSPGHPGSAGKPTQSLSVLYAGSMTKVMEESIRSDVHQQDGWDFQGQGAGSRALAQMMVSGLRQPDVFVSASPTVNDQLLMNGPHPVAGWYITLARDEMVIAYSPKSRFAADLESAKSGRTAWYNVLREHGFLLGRTDPKLDPKGVNVLLTMALASTFYHVPGLSQDVLGSAENPSQVFPEETLLSRLETGQLDAVFAYRHEAVEWGLPYIPLPHQINLGDPQFSDTYRTASVQVGNLTQRGDPIVFTITIPNKAPHPAAALDFVRYMLTGHGHTLLLQHGYEDVPPDWSGQAGSLPAGLQSVVQGVWSSGGSHS